MVEIGRSVKERILNGTASHIISLCSRRKTHSRQSVLVMGLKSERGSRGGSFLHTMGQMQLSIVANAQYLIENRTFSIFPSFATMNGTRRVFIAASSSPCVFSSLALTTNEIGGALRKTTAVLHVWLTSGLHHRLRWKQLLVGTPDSQ